MSISSLTLEDQLLLCCARVNLSEENKLKTIQLLEGNLDWEYIVQTAIQNNLVPLLYHNLKTFKFHCVPSALREKLHDLYYLNVKRNITLFGELGKLLKAFNGSGIPVIPFKGAFLAEKVYANIALRPMEDLDLLIKTEDYYRVKDLLASLGYKGQVFRTPFHEYVFHTVPIYGEISFAKGSTIIDVHWDIRPIEKAVTLNASHFWCNARLTELSNSTVYTFSPEDLIIHLCLHSYKHLIMAGESKFKFAFFCDIAEAVRFYGGEINWERFVATVENDVVGDIIFYCLNQAYMYLDAPIPVFVLNHLSNSAENADQDFSDSPFAVKNRNMINVKKYDLLRINFSNKIDTFSKFKIIYGFLIPGKEYVSAHTTGNHHMFIKYILYYFGILSRAPGVLIHNRL
ncbi:nucleotidyltransferase domain-containing protein [Methanocella sp. MCL-LM]|uniref:nucleotidyltransferase domain-containing protein n=1 Tax=Methanocella sp. MCL-LM TaxID=3412035 RepID=UPI003C793723